MGVRLPRGALSVVDGIAWEVVRRSGGGAHGGVGSIHVEFCCFAKAAAQTDDATELRSLVLDNPLCVICNCNIDFCPITILTKLRITVLNYA